MNQDSYRDPISEQLGEVAPGAPASLMPRVVSTVETGATSHRGVFAAVGPGAFAVLAGGALGIVLLGSHTRPSNPARTRPIEAGSPPVVSTRADIPAEDLAAAKLSNVAKLVTGYDITSSGGGVQARLVGAYSDAARTVILIRVSGAAPGTIQPSITDDQGVVNSALRQVTSPNGDTIFEFDRPLRPTTGDTSSVSLRTQFASLPAGSTGGPLARVPGPTFDFRLRVEHGQALPRPAPARTSGATFTFDAVELTPNAVDLSIHESGATIDALTAAGRGTEITIIGPSGEAVAPIAFGYSVTTPKGQLNRATAGEVRLHMGWIRATAGTYRIKFNFGSGRVFERAIAVP